MNRQALDELKQQIPLMGYLQAHDWYPARPLSRGRWMGLCPLHGDHKPSFLVDPNKNLFYCYGCGRGGDVIRLAELYHREVPASFDVTAPMAWLGAVVAPSRRFLMVFSYTATPRRFPICINADSARRN